jgi:hypothetical protein
MGNSRSASAHATLLHPFSIIANLSSLCNICNTCGRQSRSQAHRVPEQDDEVPPTGAFPGAFQEHPVRSNLILQQKDHSVDSVTERHFGRNVCHRTVCGCNSGKHQCETTCMVAPKAWIYYTRIFPKRTRSLHWTRWGHAHSSPFVIRTIPVL